MTAATSLPRGANQRAEQVEHLRRKIAAVSDKMSRGHTAPHPDEQLLPSAKSLLPIPESLAERLPGGLPRGSVAVISGARSLTVALVASVTAAGGHVAIVGQPRIGLLAAVEMGADLSRLAVIPEPGADPAEVAAVLTDGMDLVVLGLGGRTVPLSRTRAVAARARSKGCCLLVTDGDWQGASLRLEARVSGYEITGRPGTGRIGRVKLAVRTAGRAAPEGRAALRASG